MPDGMNLDGNNAGDTIHGSSIAANEEPDDDAAALHRSLPV